LRGDVEAGGAASRPNDGKPARRIKRVNTRKRKGKESEEKK